MMTDNVLLPASTSSDFFGPSQQYNEALQSPFYVDLEVIHHESEALAGISDIVLYMIWCIFLSFRAAIHLFEIVLNSMAFRRDCILSSSGEVMTWRLYRPLKSDCIDHHSVVASNTRFRTIMLELSREESQHYLEQMKSVLEMILQDKGPMWCSPMANLGMGSLKLGMLAKSLAINVNMKWEQKGILSCAVQDEIAGYAIVGKSSMINCLCEASYVSCSSTSRGQKITEVFSHSLKMLITKLQYDLFFAFSKDGALQLVLLATVACTS